MHAFWACVLGVEIADHSNRASMHRQSMSSTHFGSENQVMMVRAVIGGYAAV